MSVPPDLTRSVVDGQYGAVAAWAARRKWTVTRPAGQIVLRAAAYHPGGQLVEVIAAMDGYPALPPAWRFVTPGTDNPSTVFPQAGAQPGVGGSIFHPNRVICAPWNQLAYSQHGGPHNDWVMSGWQEVTGVTRATTIADMLDQIDLHLRASPAMA